MVDGKLDAASLRKRAARCLMLAAGLPAGPVADQLRLFAKEFTEMAAEVEAATAVVIVKQPETAGGGT